LGDGIGDLLLAGQLSGDVMRALMGQDLSSREDRNEPHQTGKNYEDDAKCLFGPSPALPCFGRLRSEASPTGHIKCFAAAES
jgi:hypothetical protein